MLPLQPTTRLLALGASGMLDIGDVAMVAHAALIADIAWPEASIALAADPLRLPFVEAVFDAVLAMLPLHAGGLRELWRVLAPAGVMVVVAPRRALLPHRPSLAGAPQSRRSLSRLLDAAMFETDDWTSVAGVHVVRVVKRDGLAPVGPGGTRARARLGLAA